MSERTRNDRRSSSDAVVKSVETTITIIEAIKALEGATVTELESATGLTKGAIYKHLATLSKHDFVVKRGNEYGLGFRFLDYGGWLRSQYTGTEIVKPQIREIAERTNEVALFGVPENGRICTLFRENGTQGVLTRTRLGRRLHLHQTAGGKAILSQWSRSAVERHCDEVGLPGATENTITDRDALFDELEAVREAGYAVNREESTEGVKAIAVPIVPDETVLGACAVAGPRHRMADERLEDDIASMLLSVVNEVELNIAHS